MTPRKAILSALHFFIVFLFFMGGIFFATLPYAPKALEILTQQSKMIALALLSIAALLFLIFYALEKGKYLVIRMGVKVNLKMVRQAVEECFEKQFLKKITLKEIGIGPKDHLEFLVSASSDEKELFASVENQLSILLQERFGYSKQFNLIEKH